MLASKVRVLLARQYVTDQTSLKSLGFPADRRSNPFRDTSAKHFQFPIACT